jgi:hypothetical protein
MSERGELHVTVQCPPQGGGQLTGAPGHGDGHDRSNDPVVHQ